MEKQIQFISTSPRALVNLIDESVKRQLDDLKKSFQPKEPTEYLTRQEVSKMFSIDLSTVHNWSKKGKLIPYGLGGRIYYKRSEVESALIKLKN